MSLAELIGSAGSLLAITGAGISAESGIPTYRGVAGLYNADDGAEVTARLSYDRYRRDPADTFRVLNEMLARCNEAQPNAAHHALARLQQRMPRVSVLTQNVDGLHAEAGTADLIEIHGNILRLRCPRCGHRQTVRRGVVPRADPCPACPSGILRHDVVLFGEALDLAVTARYDALLQMRFDVCCVIGTTALFGYIQQAARTARQRGATLVEINPQQTPLSDDCDLVLRQSASQALAGLR